METTPGRRIREALAGEWFDRNLYDTAAGRRLRSGPGLGNLAANTFALTISRCYLVLRCVTLDCDTESIKRTSYESKLRT